MKKIRKSELGSPSLEYIGVVVLVGVVVLAVIAGFGIALKNSLEASQEQVQRNTYEALCKSQYPENEQKHVYKGSLNEEWDPGLCG